MSDFTIFPPEEVSSQEIITDDGDSEFESAEDDPEAIEGEVDSDTIQELGDAYFDAEAELDEEYEDEDEDEDDDEGDDEDEDEEISVGDLGASVQFEAPSIVIPTNAIRCGGTPNTDSAWGG